MPMDKTDRLMIGAVLGMIALVIIGYGAIGYVVAHFIAKLW